MASRCARRYSSRRQSQSVCHNVASLVPKHLCIQPDRHPVSSISSLSHPCAQTHGTLFVQQKRFPLPMSFPPHLVCHESLAEQAASYRCSASSDKQGPGLNIECKFKTPRNASRPWRSDYCGGHRGTHRRKKRRAGAPIAASAWWVMGHQAICGHEGTLSAPNERIPGD